MARRLAWRGIAVLTLLLTLLGAPAPVARAATLTVTNAGDSGANTLRQAIADAIPGDTIVFDLTAMGTDTITLTSGQLAIAKNLTIAGPGADLLRVRRDPTATNFRVFDISAGAVTISGLTISNGKIVDSVGAGIFVYNGAQLQLRDSILENNQTSGTLAYGGGFHLFGAATSAVLTRVTARNNSAIFAGGVGAEIGTLTVIDSTFTNNSATALRGGGLGALVMTNLTISGSTFTANSALQAGGGIYMDKTAASISNTTITGNSASTPGFGAGFVQIDGNPTLTNVTIGGNTGYSNIYNESTTLHLKNSIIAGHGRNCHTDVGTFVNEGNNLDTGTTCGFGSNNGSISNTPALLDTTLGDNATARGTQTLALQIGSPAIDAGDQAACPATDQRGISRPQGVRCDIGAFELSPAAPAPIITGIDPAATPIVASADPDLTLTVSGTGFVDGVSVVRLGATLLATTYVSATELTAVVPAALRAAAGSVPITVTNVPPGGGTSNPLNLTLTNPAPNPTDLSPVGTTVGSGATGLAIGGGDFAPGATVDFGGTTLTPTSVTTTAIGVTIPAALLTTARTVPVTVTNPGPGGGTSGPLTFTVGNPAPTATSLDPGSVTAGGAAFTLTVTGTGFATGAAIDFGGQALATTLIDATQVSATVPAGAIQAAGTLQVRVIMPGPGGGTSGPLDFVVNPAGANQLASAGGQAQTTTVATAFATALAVVVRDQFGNPVAPGTTVTFIAPSGGASGTFPGGLTTTTATTDATGLATAPTFTANGVAGSYSVIATAGGGAIPFALTNTPGPAASLAVTAPGAATAGAAIALTVTVRDANGNIVPAYTGTIGFASGDPQATLPADYPYVGGDNGAHSFVATLRTAGSRTITVTDTAIPALTGTATIAVAPAAPTQIAVTGGTPQSGPILAPFAPLAARVQDTFGNPLAGIAVTFAAPASGAGATFPGGGASVVVATASDGVATAPTTIANGTTGAYSIVASSVAGAVTFTLTNTPGPAARLDIAAPPSALADVAVPLTLTVRDAQGNIVTGYTGTIRFTSDDSQASLPADATFVAGDGGVRSFAATLRTGGLRTLTATDTANAALTATVSIAVVAPTTATVTASASGQGTVTPDGARSYPVGSIATYAAQPAAGQVFLGWTLDGRYVGFASSLDFTVGGDRTLVATFAARPSFGDVPTSDPDHEAITFLAALGIVNPAGVNGSGNFEPGREVARAEMAAFVARVFDWETEFHANAFPDRCDAQGLNCIDDELWNTVAALQDYGVVGGYTDPATCASAGTAAPCYLPRDPVKRVQVVSIVARAFTRTPDLRPTGFWDRLPADPARYTNVPDAGSQRSDLTTYRANAGPIPGQSGDTTFPNPEGNAARRFVIAVLYQAFATQYGTDRVP